MKCVVHDLHRTIGPQRLAIQYRKRLEQEWEEQVKIWRVLDKKAEIGKWERKQAWVTAQTAKAEGTHESEGDIFGHEEVK